MCAYGISLALRNPISFLPIVELCYFRVHFILLCTPASYWSCNIFAWFILYFERNPNFEKTEKCADSDYLLETSWLSVVLYFFYPQLTIKLPPMTPWAREGNGNDNKCETNTETRMSRSTFPFRHVEAEFKSISDKKKTIGPSIWGIRLIKITSTFLPYAKQDLAQTQLFIVVC